MRFGDEFWHHPADPAVVPPSGRKSVAQLDVSAAVDRVRHALAPGVEGRSAQLRTPTFAASFDDQGLHFTPLNPTAIANVGTLDPEALFQTLTVRRGAQLLYSSPGAATGWSALGNTLQTRLGSLTPLVEHYETGVEGVAVSWVLGVRPPGDGPLVIESRLAGLVYDGHTEQGHHFADPAGIARVRVGEVTAVDATGRRWPVPMEVNGGRLAVDVSEAILMQANYPLAIDPWISPEFGTDQPVVTPAAFVQFAPKVAFDGTVHLAVWSREAPGGTGLGQNVQAARISASGELLDPLGFPLSDGGLYQGPPAIAAIDNGFFVVWTDGLPDRSGVQGALVDPLGTVRKRLVVVPESPDYIIFAPVIAGAGDGFLAVWQRHRNVTLKNDIVASRVTPEGVALEPAGIPVSPSPNQQTEPAVAFNGHDHLVVWNEFQSIPGPDHDIRAARLGADGVSADPAGIAVSVRTGDQTVPAVASLKGDFMVVWNDTRNSPPGPVLNGLDVYGARVSAAGNLLDPEGIPIAVQAELQAAPAIASDAHQYFVAWEDRRQDFTDKIYATRVSPDGQVIDPDGIRISGPGKDQDTPAITVSAEGFLLVWRRDGGASGKDITGALVRTDDPTIGIGPQSIFSRGANLQLAPAVASNGRDYMVVWQDNRNEDATDQDIYGVRLAPDGTVLDPNGIAICTAARDQSSPAIGVSGRDYLVAWRDQRDSDTTQDDIYGALLRDGILRAGPFAICTSTNSQRAPAVAGGPDSFLVVWRDEREVLTNGADIYGTQVNLSGGVALKDGFVISAAIGDQQAPVVASNGTGYLVAWRDSRNLVSGTSDDIYGAFVGPTGGSGTNFPISTALGVQRAPDLAANGPTYLVAWRDDRLNNRTVPHIYATRVTETEGVMNPDGIALSGAARNQREPTVAAAGEGWFVAWHDDRNLTAIEDIFGTEIGGDGRSIAGSEVKLSTGDSNLDVLGLVARSDAELLLIGEGRRGTSSRVFAQLLQLGDRTPALTIRRDASAVIVEWPVSPRFPSRLATVQTAANLSQWLGASDLLTPPSLLSDGRTAQLRVPIGNQAPLQTFFRLKGD